MKIKYGTFLGLMILAGAYACTTRNYTMETTGMEGTIMAGERVRVQTRINRIQRNDIIAFTYHMPSGENKIWIFRVAALPGDSLEIRNGRVWVNGSEMATPELAKFSYVVRTSGTVASGVIQDAGLDTNPTDQLILHLTAAQAGQLRRDPAVLDVSRVTEPISDMPLSAVSENEELPWNEDTFGPIYIPRPGETVKISNANFRLYNNLQPEEKTGTIQVNDEIFFLLGDNRHNAMDSRFIGFVSRADIIGIVQR